MSRDAPELYPHALRGGSRRGMQFPCSPGRWGAQAASMPAGRGARARQYPRLDAPRRRPARPERGLTPAAGTRFEVRIATDGSPPRPALLSIGGGHPASAVYSGSAAPIISSPVHRRVPHEC